MLNEFLNYRSQGFSVIPVGKNKRSCIKWEKYQKEIATENEIRRWLAWIPDAQIAIVTGAISGLDVLDIDIHKGGDSEPFLCETTTVRTGSGGLHLWFKHEPGLRSNAHGDTTHIDIRADGGYAVAPPSWNENGQYIFTKQVKELLPFPMDLMHLITVGERHNKTGKSGPVANLVRKPYVQPNTTPKIILQAKKLPIKFVVMICAKAVGIKICWRENPDGTSQIIEDGIITSGFINPATNICHRSSGRQRAGDPVNTAEGYLCDRGNKHLYPQEIAALLLRVAKKIVTNK